jgi:prepilin-type N-terminal cleavage/methylation domain-containing protein
VARSHEVARSLARRGFTLVELIVVLVVIAIAGFVAVPELIRAMEVGADDGEVAPFTSLLRYARQRSIENAVIVRLIVDPEGLRYRADSAGVWGAGLLEEGIIELDPGVRMESDSTRLNYTFRPDGSAFGDTVVVSGRWGSSHVSLDRWTGAINVYPY